MNVVLISDFNLSGSGYLYIASSIGIHLSKRGHRVTALGIGYKRDEHHFPFPLIRVDKLNMFEEALAMLYNLKLEKNYVDCLIVALDVPKQITALAKWSKLSLPYYGVFPIEAGPLTQSWAMALALMTKRFTISQFGADECQRVGLDATHLPIAVDMEAWRPPTVEERDQLRSALRIKPEQKVVLTVAENQERKNLSANLEIIQRASVQDPSILHVLVTRRETGVGWGLDDYIAELGIQERVQIYERGMPFNRLWGLFSISDAFLIASRAEGLGMPVLEAMSCGLPVVAPNHTAFKEHLSFGRGYLYDNVKLQDGTEFRHRDAFGNEYRYFADVESGTHSLLTALNDPNPDTTIRAKEYVSQRSWEKTIDIFEEAAIAG